MPQNHTKGKREIVTTHVRVCYKNDLKLLISAPLPRKAMHSTATNKLLFSVTFSFFFFFVVFLCVNWLADSEKDLCFHASNLQQNCLLRVSFLQILIRILVINDILTNVTVRSI